MFKFWADIPAPPPTVNSNRPTTLQCCCKQGLCVCMCVCMSTCMRAYVHVCMHACVRFKCDGQPHCDLRERRLCRRELTGWVCLAFRPMHATTQSLSRVYRVGFRSARKERIEKQNVASHKRYAHTHTQHWVVSDKRDGKFFDNNNKSLIEKELLLRIVYEGGCKTNKISWM